MSKTINIDGFEIDVNDPYLKDRIALAQRFNECQNTVIEKSDGKFTVSTVKAPQPKLYHTVITAPSGEIHTIEYYLSMFHAERAHHFHVEQCKQLGNNWDKYEHYEKP
jgi:hypothetical protein